MASPASLIVAPNGARRTTADHARLPVTPEQIAYEAELAARAGATMVHAHARDEQQRHTLDIECNRAVYSAIKQRVGEGIVVQLTTEAVGIFTPDQQMALIEALHPEAASFALRELFPDASWTQRSSDFLHAMQSAGVVAQYILYSAEEVSWYHQLKADGVLPAGPHHLLFVLGRYSAGQQSHPTDLLPFVTAHQDDTPWAVCAFGALEHRCACAALALGGDVRVGFENNLLDKHGVLAQSNATQIAQVAEAAAAMARPLLSAEAFRVRYRQAATS